MRIRRRAAGGPPQAQAPSSPFPLRRFPPAPPPPTPAPPPAPAPRDEAAAALRVEPPQREFEPAMCEAALFDPGRPFPGGNPQEEKAKSGEDTGSEKKGGGGGEEGRPEREHEQRPVHVVCLLLAAPKGGEEQRPSEVMKKKREDSWRVDEGKSTAAAAMCKKGDGKGWHCKRAAQCGYSLCPHHLDKLRSYSHSQTKKKKKKETKKKTKPKAPPAAGKPTAAGAHHQGASQQEKNGNKKRVEEHVLGTGPGAVSDSFYYYSGFGPWWGKRRRDGRSSVDAGKVHDGSASQAQLPQHTDDAATAAAGGEGEGEDQGEEGELHERDSGGGRDGRPWKSRALSSLL